LGDSPVRATKPSLPVKPATEEPGYPAGLPGWSNRVSFVIPGQPGRATRLVCRGTRAAQIFRQKSIALQCFFVARPGMSARVSRHPCSPAEHTTFFSFKFTYFMTHDVSLPLNSTHYAMLYPQNGDRIVAIDSVTSLHRM